jgi:hypothetical protein
VFACSFQTVALPDGTLNEYIKGPVIPALSSPLPSSAVTDITTADTGVPCLVIQGVVYTSVVAGVVTPSGQVKLTCKGAFPS